MNNVLSKRLVTIAAIFSVALVSGCSSLNTMVSDETRYGQIYMLEEVLRDAVADCGNKERLFDARQWAMQVSFSLKEHTQYLNKESASYSESRKLLKQLPLISGHYGEPSCDAIALAGEQTRTLLKTLSAASIVVASR
jgi:hypothetical protein